jgi:rod shape-determining protein MreD
MINKISFFIAGLLLLVLQAHPFLPLAGQGIRPDFLLIFTIYVGIYFSTTEGALMCFLLGYCAETLSGAPCGLYQLLYFCVFASIKPLKRVFSFEMPVNLCLLLLFCLCLKLLILLFSFQYLFEYKHFLFTKTFLQETIITLLFYPFIFFLLKRIHGQKKEILQPHRRLKNGLRPQ